ncbi:MAG: PASTA domain-containing protein [Actinomycetota bacterium]
MRSIRLPVALVAMLVSGCSPEALEVATTSPSPATDDPSPAVVPDLVGESSDVAFAAADASGWQLVVFEELSKRKQGTVLSQDPAPGVALARGGTLTVTLAVGKAPPTTEPPPPSFTTGPPGPPPPPPGGGGSGFGDGTYRVGSDIQPGTYRTRSGSEGCYWERLSGFGGDFDDIIANDNTDFPEVVTIASSDEGFSTRRCAPWSSDLSRVSVSSAAVDQGTWIVGTDFSPGTYRTSGGDGCYWERLRGFGGEVDDIIANDNPSGSAVVTISASDAGFSTVRCGRWTAA